MTQFNRESNKIHNFWCSKVIWKSPQFWHFDTTPWALQNDINLTRISAVVLALPVRAKMENVAQNPQFWRAQRWPTPMSSISICPAIWTWFSHTSDHKKEADLCEYSKSYWTSTEITTPLQIIRSYKQRSGVFKGGIGRWPPKIFWRLNVVSRGA